MQLAERGAVFGNIDLFKVRGKYAASDAYEYHYNLPKGKTLMITHRRVILLQVCPKAPPSHRLLYSAPETFYGASRALGSFQSFLTCGKMGVTRG